MKFDSRLDYLLAIKRVESHIHDEAFLNKIKSCTGNEIPDNDYYLLSDDFNSYMNELKLHSKTKTFYKRLVQDELTHSNIPDLCAMMTHFSLGLCNRLRVRDNVDYTDYVKIRDSIIKKIDTILKKEKVKNDFIGVLK